MDSEETLEPIRPHTLSDSVLTIITLESSAKRLSVVVRITQFGSFGHLEDPTNLLTRKC